MIGDRTWAQEFTAASVTENMLAKEAEVTGLRLPGWLNDTRTWAYLTPALSPPIN